MKRPTSRVLTELTLMAFYVSAGWVLLTHFSNNRAAATTIPLEDVRDGAGVTVTIRLLEGGSIPCATTANWASTDSVVVSASEVTRVFGELNCREPSGT